VQGESPAEGDEVIERFSPTSGRIPGILGLLVAAGVVVLWVWRPDDVAPAVAAVAAVAGVICWAALLRPRVSASAETLYLRNMLETVEVPLAAVDELVLRQVLVLRVGEKKIVSPAVGRKLRKVAGVRQPILFGPDLDSVMSEPDEPLSSDRRPATQVDYADHVEGRLRELVQAARDRHGVRRYSDEALALADDVRRRPAWPEIGALALALGLVAAAVLVG
jgi:hypothetical protein